MNAFERRQQIIERMQIRKFDTAQNLAIEFKVSKKTILRDVQEISCSGYQIQSEKGNDGGIRWVGNKKSFPFSEREQIALRNAIALVSAEDKPILENLLCANEKLRIRTDDIFKILSEKKTQRELASELCISESYLSRLLSGQKKPSSKLDERISKLIEFKKVKEDGNKTC